MGLIEHCYETCGTNMTGKLLDDVKDIGFNTSISGLTISLSDLETPPESLPLSMRLKRGEKLRNVLIVKNLTLKKEKKG